jgi:DNA topoisomerase-3
MLQIHGYKKIDADLCLPTMRAAVEQQLDLIALGKAEFDDVLLHFTHLFQKKFDYFEKCIPLMDQLFEVPSA